MTESASTHESPDDADPPVALPLAVEALREAHAIAFTLMLNGVSRAAFVIRADGALYAFVDSCRHQSRSLDLGAGPALQDGLLPCRHHGALYRVSDGSCVVGPCAGTRLTKLALEERAGRWWCVGRAG